VVAMSSETADGSIAAAKPTAAPTSRRGFLLGLGLALNAIAATLFAVPVLRYVMAPGRRLAWLAWIPLGSLTEFPEGRTRLASYENPFVRPWDGETGKIPCWVRRLQGESFQVFAINCTHLGCPVRWFEASGLGCLAPAQSGRDPFRIAP
jgi:menaquinol-cytochrome c reductase iron-sulfur subunit